VENFDNPKEYNFSKADIAKNIQNIVDYLKIDDDSISYRVGSLYSAIKTSNDTNVLSSRKFSFINKGEEERTFFVPSRTYNLSDSAT